MNRIEIQYYKTGIGEMILGAFEGQLCMLDYRYRRMRPTIDKRISKGLNAAYVERNNDMLMETKKQVDEYLLGNILKFDIPILMVGSDFQKKVWNALLDIGYGETASYGELAQKIGTPNSVRAVASANGANAISIIVPCHRIIGSNGELTGYAGGLPVKKKLLDLEKMRVK
jgi:methylated-DNA-[protein]-cysteine S-methyltransferase